MHAFDPGPSSAPGAVRRIAIVSDHASPLARPGAADAGAQNVYVAQLACALGQAGYLVDVFTRRDSMAQKQVVQWRERVRVIHVPAGPPYYIPREQVLAHTNNFARFVTRHARQQPAMYDVVHANSFTSGMVARHVRNILGIPFVVTFHGLGHVRRLATGCDEACPAGHLAIESGLMRQADRLIATCVQERSDMEQLYGAERGRIDIAPCGFDPGELWPVPMALARQQLGLDPDSFTVLQVGTMVASKGIDTVIESLAMLRDRHAVSATLLVAGGDAPFAAPLESPELLRLRHVAARLGLENRVRFCGVKDRAALRSYYGAADALVATPWYEDFGITPVEAMACARPVVGAAVGGIKSTVLDGRTGYLVPPHDPQAVAARLATLWREPARARRMGDEGMRRALRHFTWHGVAERIAAIYAEAAAPGRHAGTAFARPAARQQPDM
jgi:D-inositol-3-phosphate glycosyltransferase